MCSACHQQNICFQCYCVKGLGATPKVPPRMHCRESRWMGWLFTHKHELLHFTWSMLVSFLDEHIDALTNIFSLRNIFLEAGERDSLIIYLEHLIGLLREGHCLQWQNNHRIFGQAGKRKMIHYFKNYFAFSPQNGWRLLTICKREQGLTLKGKEVQALHF